MGCRGSSARLAVRLCHFGAQALFERNTMNQFKIGTRFGLGVGLVLLITAVIAAVGFWRLSMLEKPLFASPLWNTSATSWPWSGKPGLI